MSSQVHYEEVECKSALTRVTGMDFRWSLNPYRGCVHGCHYCFARRFHAYYDLDPGDDFTSVIFVKTNVARVLSEELSMPGWRREMVSLGTATDPYQPIEGKHRVTRGCLEAFATWRSPMTLVTKGTMVVRDLDVLTDLARRTDSRVCFSITSMDRDLVRKLEPGTPPPHKRLLAMERLVQAGITAGVMLAPIVPGITDSAENLEGVARAAAASGARFLSGGVLYLKGGTKEHFLRFLGQEYPDLLTSFSRLYPGSYAPGQLQTDVQRRVDGLRRAHGLTGRRSQSQDRLAEPRQLELVPR